MTQRHNAKETGTAADPAGTELSGKFGGTARDEAALCRNSAFCLNMRDLYARPELHAVLDQALKEGILFLADKTDPEMAHWYLKGEKDLPVVEEPEFSPTDYINALKLLKAAPNPGESPLEVMLVVDDQKGIRQRIEAMGGNASPKDYEELFAQEIVGCTPYRIDPSGRLAAEEITAAESKELQDRMRENLVALAREKGVQLLMSEVVDPHAMTPAEKGKWSRENGTRLQNEIENMAAAGFYIPNSFVIQGGEPYSRLVMPAIKPLRLGIEEGDPIMAKEDFVEALKWYGKNTLSLKKPEKDEGIAITIEYLPLTVELIPAGTPRACSRFILESGAAKDEVSPARAVELVKTAMGEEDWLSHQACY